MRVKGGRGRRRGRRTEGSVVGGRGTERSEQMRDRSEQTK